MLFGTDFGVANHYDTMEEYVLMAKSGMSWRDILASFTTNLATFFKLAHTALMCAFGTPEFLAASC